MQCRELQQVLKLGREAARLPVEVELAAQVNEGLISVAELSRTVRS